jgi:tetratricopeptide (TPR) repeat protein
VVKNETPYETYLELAITYANEGLAAEAVKVLELSPAYPTVYYWLAYLKRADQPGESKEYLRKAVEMSPAFVFPFRPESIPVLTWAALQLPSWKTDYYLGLVFWNNLRKDKAGELFEKCGDTPLFAPFYLARSALFQGDSTRNNQVQKDLERAVALDPEEWRTWHYYTEYLQKASLSPQNVTIAEKAWRKFKNNPVIAMDYAKGLLDANRPEACLKVLEKVLILPQEGAQEGHEIYELANITLALQMLEQGKYKQAFPYLKRSMEWPERLGTGKPYDPDNRLQDFIAAYCEGKLGRSQAQQDYYQQITDYSLLPGSWENTPATNYISMRVLPQQGKEPELRQLATNWKAKQDSLSNWNIMPGSSAPEFKWVMAKYENNADSAALLERELLAEGAAKRRFSVLLRALKATSR